MSKKTFLENHFLIAMPNMGDPQFARSVTYICEHNEEGAIGIMINRPMDIKVGDILSQLNIETQNDSLKDMPVLFGGPVNPDRGFVIHRINLAWRSTLESSKDIAITTSRDILDSIAKDDSSQDILISLGYAGWSAGQLEEEIGQNFWLVIPADPKIMFNTPYVKRWKEAGAILGIDISTLPSVVGHA